ncbi:cobalt-precorrin-6A reductase [Gordonia sp. ABSL1-1]|uniref:cobalt-precorrin-6A reductase n=1 Tax=Gordonia sp. ABSL1-1 TaxID=3053923 RepID=UPI0025746595|nr:cobalt-precorrin-6A reductase [Gordonia sp. ABSL1-1]MDL9935918.1 cobalt-precorrin-6A reductase [Gordonia sp. ABSL1-1]
MPEGDAPVLILGGTGEARDLAATLVEVGVPVISSLAGRVRDPRLPQGEVRIGGFGGIAGLAQWLATHQVRAVVDATHPFAAVITANAVEACALAGVQLLRLRRDPWVPGAADRWVRVPDIDTAATEVDGRGRRVLLTTGRQDADAFAGIDSAWFLIRVVDPPTGKLPAHHEILRSRGPYRLEDELELMRSRAIDLLVTKNSGGELTRAKLRAAALLDVPVVMVDRPTEPPVPTAATASAAADWVAGLR